MGKKSWNNMVLEHGCAESLKGFKKQWLVDFLDATPKTQKSCVWSSNNVCFDDDAILGAVFGPSGATQNDPKRANIHYSCSKINFLVRPGRP